MLVNIHSKPPGKTLRQMRYEWFLKEVNNDLYASVRELGELSKRTVSFRPIANCKILYPEPIEISMER